MPYKGDGKQFSIRVPNELWKKIENYFKYKEQSHLSKNAKILTLLKERFKNIDSNDMEGGLEVISEE